MSEKKTAKCNPIPKSWVICEICKSTILLKDWEIHILDCGLINFTELSHNFVQNGALYGILEVKSNKKITGVSLHEHDNLVFLSQSVIQLCGMSIGEHVAIEDVNTGEVVSRIVWPTTEKSLASILLSAHSLENSKMKVGSCVRVSKLPQEEKTAKKIVLVILNAPKNMDLSDSLKDRLGRLYRDHFVAEGNVISTLFYGKMLHFAIKIIEGNDNKTSENTSIKTVDMCENIVKTIAQSASLEMKLAQMKLSKNLYKIVEGTSLVFFKDEKKYKRASKVENPYGKIGGLNAEISELTDLINSALGKTSMAIGFKPTRGVLLYGTSGTGKTLLAKACASASCKYVVEINSADLYSKYSGNPEDNIKTLFAEALDASPSVILMDEVDVLCPSRSSRMTESEKRIVSSVLTQLDEINALADKKRIFILATTNKLEAIDTAFRRCGRFEREIEIHVPNPKARHEILLKILESAKNESVIDPNLIQDVANNTHGFVGADLVALCSRAALHASQNQRNFLQEEDFKFALTHVRPSAMREVQIEVPNVQWSEIGGQEKLKLILKQCVEWPLKHAESFTRMGITPPRGVLMYGPPGCSKTMIAKALATESGLNFISIKGPELFSKWVGESERAVRDVFRKARQVAPSIVFFDEIDALGGERTSAGNSNNVQERVLAQLLTELDGVTPLGDVTILAATNRPDRIDKALLRPGRLDRIVYVPLPDEETRRDIFRIKLEKMPVSNVNIEELVKKTNKYSGAEVNAVCHEAAMMALEEDLSATNVEMRHFLKALDLIIPRTSDSLLKIYEEYHS